MIDIVKIESNGKEYHLNFRSYAVRQVYKFFNTSDLGTINSVDLLFKFVHFSLTDNGRKEVQEVDVDDFFDGIGGILGEKAKDLQPLILKAFGVTEQAEEDSKKK